VTAVADRYDETLTGHRGMSDRIRSRRGLPAPRCGPCRERPDLV